MRGVVRLEAPHGLAVKGDAISADGRFVLFETNSSLAPEDTNRCLYALIANTSSTAGSASVTVYAEGVSSTLAIQTLTLPANSRTNVPIAQTFPVGYTARVAVVVESSDADLVVERSQYWNVNGVLWAAGTASLGTPIP